MHFPNSIPNFYTHQSAVIVFLCCSLILILYTTVSRESAIDFYCKSKFKNKFLSEILAELKGERIFSIDDLEEEAICSLPRLDPFNPELWSRLKPWQDRFANCTKVEHRSLLFDNGTVVIVKVTSEEQCWYRYGRLWRVSCNLTWRFVYRNLKVLRCLADFVV
jgi:hypothetical protein